MGLLDDAIREHLDLKRRRGADPTEIERAEQEALGPVRREPIGSEDLADPEASGYQDVEAGPSISEAAPPVGHSPADDDEDWDDEDEYEPESDFELGHPSVDAAVSGPASRSPDDRPDVVRPGAVPPPADPGPEPGETVSFPSEPEQPDAAQDDVLEETPEFLQDTPDHDRLWFEQRPPRDFDFDE